MPPEWRGSYHDAMSKFASSFDTSWRGMNDLEEITDWICNKGLEGFELKSLTATTNPNTEYDPETGDEIEVWRAYYVAVVQRPKA